MFLNREYIPAVPIREEQRVKEEEELARQLKREARIFFPDSRLPDFSTQDLPPLPDGSGNGEENPPQENRKPKDSSNADRVIIEDHDDVCREEDSAWRNPDGSFSRHDEIAAAREEADRIEANRKQQWELQGQNSETVLQNEGEKPFHPHLNKQEIRKGIRWSVILDKPRGMNPWKEDNF